MNEAPLFIVVLIFLQSVSLLSLFLLNRKYQALKEKLKNRPYSLELTEFLSDTRSGFSFVRVDPESVFIRSPREFKN
jgi:hypothetical protein